MIFCLFVCFSRFLLNFCWFLSCLACVWFFFFLFSWVSGHPGMIARKPKKLEFPCVFFVVGVDRLVGWLDSLERSPKFAPKRLIGKKIY